MDQDDSRNRSTSTGQNETFPVTLMIYHANLESEITRIGVRTGTNSRSSKEIGLLYEPLPETIFYSVYSCRKSMVITFCYTAVPTAAIVNYQVC